MTRLEKAAVARRLRDEDGLMWREIGARLGVSKSMAFDLYHDPTGEKARERKARFARPCVDCGKTINPNGVRTSTVRCRACNAVKVKAETRRWILDSFAEWYEQFGEVPTVADWSPAHARVRGQTDKLARHAATGRPWPCQPIVRTHFGSWDAGLEAAGFKPLAPNERWIGRRGLALRDEDMAA